MNIRPPPNYHAGGATVANMNKVELASMNKVELANMHEQG